MKSIFFLSLAFTLTASAGPFVFIAPEAPKPEGRQAGAAFAKTFVNAKEVKGVRSEVSALGVYNLFVNGSPVGDEAYLKPGFTHAFKRRLSLAYDLTSVWKTASGATNAVSAFVGSSWWNDYIGSRIEAPLAFAAKIVVAYADGTEETLATDTSWNASYDTPYMSASIYGGEWYDARVSADARACAADGRSVVATNFTGVVSPFVGPTVELRRDLALAADKADIVVKPGDRIVVDFGQNCAGVPEFTAQSEPGVTLVIRPAEMLNDEAGEGKHGNDGPAGTVYRANLRGLANNGAWVNYVFGSGESVTWHPSFTFFGYRYAELSSKGGEVRVKSIVSLPVTSVRKGLERGTLKTGVKDLNRFVENVRWGHYSNYLSIPTDCPQRNERHGWTADTQVFAAAALYDADCYDFLRKWMGDMRDSQDEKTGAYPSVAPYGGYRDCGMNRLGWGDAGVIVPWTCWRMTGRREIIEENWDSMCRFMDSLDRVEAKTTDNWQYADWLSYEKLESYSGSCWESGDMGKTDHPFPDAVRYWNYLGACYWYLDARYMAEMARVIGKGADAEKFAAMAAKARAYLRKEFFEADGGLLAVFRDMQTPALFALKLGLYDDDAARTAAVEGLKANIRNHGDCLQTGFLGTSIIMDALTEADAADVAYTLLLQHKNPSWLYSVDQGATTVWERWNSYVKETGFGIVEMNSFNHYAYGAVLAWMYGTMAGIQPGPKGGFDDEFHLAPVPDARLGFVEASYRTKNGLIRSAWRYTDGKCLWKFSVPPNSKAIVCVNGLCRPYAAGDYELEIVK